MDISQNALNWATFITAFGTMAALFVARVLDRMGQKENKEQNQLAHDLKERESRWDQMTDTLSYQRDLINDLKGDIKDAKGRVLNHINYQERLEELAEDHRVWDELASESNPELPSPPPIYPGKEEDPYFG